MDGTRYPVGPGDVAYIPPDALHSVVNEAEGVLEWAAFWWVIMAPRDRNDSTAEKKIMLSTMFSMTGKGH